MSLDKYARLRKARMCLIIALFSLVLLCFAWIIQCWHYGQYWVFLPGFAFSFLFFSFLFLRFAPLCDECKKTPWSIFGRTAICCFAEKVSLRKSVQRTLKIIAIVYIVGGIITIYIRPIYAYGKKASAFIEEKTRKPALERFLKTEAKLKKRLAENSKDRDARMELGWLYFRVNKLNLASKQYAQLNRDFPDDPEAKLLQAIILGELKQALQEEKAYEKILEIDPHNTEALINMGLVYLKNKLRPEAMAKLEKARKLLTQDYRGLQKKVEAKGKEADEQLKQDLKAARFHLAVAYYHLAVTAKLMGKKKLKAKYFKRAKKLGYPVDNFDRDVARFR